MFAARPGDRDLDDLYRGRFSIYGVQLRSNLEHQIVGERFVASATRGGPLFWGPYWVLKAGRYNLKVHGEVEGALTMTITERFGQSLTTFSLPNGAKEGKFAIDLDAANFECVARAASDRARVSVERIEIIRI